MFWMRSPWEDRPLPWPPFTKTTRKLFLDVVAALMAMALMMGFLNYLFRLERTNRANGYYRAAEELMRHGSYEEAIARYRFPRRTASITAWRWAWRW
jgi:hypothetical protein